MRVSAHLPLREGQNGIWSANALRFAIRFALALIFFDGDFSKLRRMLPCQSTT
jgi:hypothetical protein